MSNLYNTKVIVGLGNPGKKYSGTRHNIGFDIVDYIFDECNRSSFSPMSWTKKFEAEVCQVSFQDEKIFLCKPQTYMNCSGDPLSKFLKFHKISPQECLVIHDEVDMPYGTIRLKIGGGEAGHNGLRSISSKLGTKDYVRMRVGVGKPEAGTPLANMAVADWVLQRFSNEEEGKLRGVFSTACDFLKEIFVDGIEKARNKFHTCR